MHTDYCKYVLGRRKIKQVLGMEPVGKGEGLRASREKSGGGGKSDSVVEEKGNIWDNRDFYLLKTRR